MPKPDQIELPTGENIPILYEDRSVVAIDKPRGWMLVPFSWQKTNRNLQAALASSIAAGDFWARSRGLRYLRFVHRLDAETTGVLLLAKSQGAVATFGALFESRQMQKVYLAVVQGSPRQNEWTCHLRLAPDPDRLGAMKVDGARGKDAETRFQVLQKAKSTALIRAEPLTGRTHQLRVHLAAAGHPVVGDDLYGAPKAGPARQLPAGLPNAKPAGSRTTSGPQNRFQASTPTKPANLGLRAVALSYHDPFTRRRVEIRAPTEPFVREYGFGMPAL